jgi:5-methylcytosine-specific restriction endonuclease McrA
MAAAKTHWSKSSRADEIRASLAEKATQQHKRQREAGYVPKNGWMHTPETRERMAQAVQRRSLVGEANPFYGRSHTAETRAKLSERLKGKRHAQSEETRRKISAALTGVNHPRWGTGHGPYAAGFTKKLKALIKERDGYRCRGCGRHESELSSSRKLHVHHLDEDKGNHDPANLLTLCVRCHRHLHRT